MPDALDLAGDIAAAVDGAALRGATLALAYVREDGSPAVSFRGSTQVHARDELALWARKRDSGLAAAIADRSRVVPARCFSPSKDARGSRPNSTTTCGPR